MEKKKEKILLVMTPDVKFYKSFIENLEYLGYDVAIILSNTKFKYKSLYDRLKNFYLKTFKNNKEFKILLKKEFERQIVLNKIKQIGNIDYVLFIRPDLFELDLIKLINSNAKQSSAYQWDGLNRFPNVYNTINLFNDFYVFDKIDLSYSKKIKPTTNFYFDCYSKIFSQNNIQYDFYFIGTYDSRIDRLLYICDKLHKKGFKLKIILRCSDRKALKNYKFVTFIKKPLTYYENLENVSKSKILIDIHHTDIHNGLSFRVFEAIGYHKKLISTNFLIKEYDFYNENNIFLFDFENPNIDMLENFINNNYLELNINIKEKYSFSNWIKYIFNKKGHTKIDIP